MKQIVQSARSGTLRLKDVPAPRVRPGHLLVRVGTSLISAGTERMVVGFARKSLIGKARARPELVKKALDKARRDGLVATIRAVMTRLDEPIPLGYSAAGIVIEAGSGISGRFRIGQRVAIAGAGLANHAEIDLVPENLAAAVPDDVEDETACFCTLGAIAMHAMRNLALGLGDHAAVIGVGLVGQLAVRFLDLAGVRVTAFDYDAERLALARQGGAELAFNLADGDPTEAIMDWTAGRGCGGVLIAAATESSAPFHLAASVARDRARISLVGLTGTELPYRLFMQKELSVVVSRSYGPGRYDPDYENRGMTYPSGWVRWTETRNLAETLRLLSHGRDRRLAVEPLISHRFPFEKAEDAYTLVAERREPHLGIVLVYNSDGREKQEKPSRPVPIAGTRGAGRCVLGVIGAGSFARTMLLPRLKDMKNCRLHTIVTQRGLSAERGGEIFGFEFTGSDNAAVLGNPEINAVLIATPHANHAALTAAALAAGKHVLVEKPLALDRAQLNTVVAARNDAGRFFLVGFNRRFAPMAAAVRSYLDARPGPRTLLLRVNAGPLPAESWQNAPEEGHGRILGEMCHFIDLARYLAGVPIVSVQATAATAVRTVCEDLTATLRFADGSLATVVYTAKGDAAFSKELVEGHAGGDTAVIDNFRRLTLVTKGRAKTSDSAAQDKGHAAELAAFVAAVAAGGAAPVSEAEQVETTFATIAVLESLRTGAPVAL